MANNTNNNNQNEKVYVNFEITWKNGDKTKFAIDSRKHGYAIMDGFIVTVIKDAQGNVPATNPTIIGSVNLAETRTVKTFLS